MVTRWSTWSKVLVLGTVLSLVIAACGTDPTPTQEPTPTPTEAEPTPTLAPGETPMPEDTPTPTPTTDGSGSEFDAEAHFRGKTITLVANSSPGGGTDAQGRVMASFLGDWIPGNPRIVFQNRPNKPQEYVFAATQAPKDGTYISWNSTPQLEFGFSPETQHIKRSSFQFIGATIDSTRSWMTYDPVGNLGEAAADMCAWDFSGMENTGGGQHGEFLFADEISDVEEGNANTISTLYALEQLEIPFDYFAFDVVDTNAVRTMWQRGDINSTVRSSLWYRFPLENPDWIPNGLMRVYANMGPGELGANDQTEPHCGPIRDHFPDEESRRIYNALQGPPNYMSKALWLPPGTPDEIADALSAGIQRAFEEDTEMVERYAAVAGETPRFTDRETGTQQTAENEAIFEESIEISERESQRLIEKYFPQYVN